MFVKMKRKSFVKYVTDEIGGILIAKGGAVYIEKPKAKPEKAKKAPESDLAKKLKRVKENK